MNDERSEQNRGVLWKRSAWTLSAITFLLGGALFIGSALPSNPTKAQAGAWRHFGHGGHGGHGEATDHAEHAEMAVEWVLRWVDGTPEQVEAISAIAKATIDDLHGLREEHRQRRDAFIAEMSKEAIDSVAIEQLRSEGMNMADDASTRLAEALVEAAGTLTVEQRLELVELAQRFHRR